MYTLSCFSVKDCRCTSEYDRSFGTPAQKALGYCNTWWSGATSPSCYLAGGLSVASCPDTTKSSGGEYYFTNNELICEGKSSHKNDFVFICIFGCVSQICTKQDPFLNPYYFLIDAQI